MNTSSKTSRADQVNHNATERRKANEKIINAIQTFQFVPNPFKNPPPSQETVRLSDYRTEVNDTDTDGMYCKAEPGSEEWKRYQTGRLNNLNTMRSEKKKSLKKKESDDRRQNLSVLKAAPSRPKSSSVSSGESIRWQEPTADKNRKSTSKVMKSVQSGSPGIGIRNRSQSPKQVLKPSVDLHGKIEGPKPLTQVIHDLRKMPPRSKAVATKKISTGIPSKGIVTTPVRIPSARVPSAKPKSATVKARPKSPKANVPSSSSTIPSDKRPSIVSKTRTRASRAAKSRRPRVPKFPSGEIMPGSPEWEEQWRKYIANMNKYELELNAYKKRFAGVSKELGKFEEKISEDTVSNDIFRMKVGMKPGANKPPLMRHIISEPITRVAGYTIRRVRNKKSTGAIASILITTFDHKGFRLDIDHSKLLTDVNSYSVKADKEYNLIVISLFDGPKLASNATEEIHIGVPMEKSVEDVIIGSPVNNGGRIVVTTPGEE